MPSQFRMPHLSQALDEAPLLAALPLFERICDIAGARDMINEARVELSRSGVLAAVDRHDDGVLFDWLMDVVSYQGIGDAAAANYMDAHGRVRASDIASGLRLAPSCPKLAAYWIYVGCRFHKGSHTCAEPDHLDRCPLPRHDLRNGRLNQTAYALFLFFRDVARGDFVGWIDDRLCAVRTTSAGDRPSQLARAMLEPLGQVQGVSSKVLSMALAELLLAAGQERALWLEAGAAMIAIDSLVHNWLHRTGVLARLGCEHPYGARCYEADGCAAIIARAATRIDSRAFNPDYPKIFPRFVQRAIWWFCAQSGMNECNGNRIDDRAPCPRVDCELATLCDHRVLHRQEASLARRKL